MFILVHCILVLICHFTSSILTKNGLLCLDLMFYFISIEFFSFKHHLVHVFNSLSGLFHSEEDGSKGVRILDRRR